MFCVLCDFFSPFYPLPIPPSFHISPAQLNLAYLVLKIRFDIFFSKRQISHILYHIFLCCLVKKMNFIVIFTSR